MTTSPMQSFRHRHNQDGSHDSICLQCFRTIDQQKDENKLAFAERNHQCEWLLYGEHPGHSHVAA